MHDKETGLRKQRLPIFLLVSPTEANKEFKNNCSGETGTSGIKKGDSNFIPFTVKY